MASGRSTQAVVAIAVLLLGVSVSAMVGSGQSSEGPNLLTNPGCDADDGSGSPPDGWTLLSANVQCTDPATVGDPTPPDGSDAFTDFSGDNSNAVVEQSVDVTGGAEYDLSGEAGRATATSDYVRIEVEYRDSSGSVLSGTGITEEVRPAGGTYESFANTAVAPTDAATAVVRVTLVDVDGTSYSDAYLNEVEFREVSTGVTAYPVSGVETGVQQTLAPSWTLHDDDYAESADDLGSEPAELVSFGGGDVGGDATTNPAGANVSLAGGHLQVNADGSFDLTNPTRTGTFTFDYRIADSSSSDEASVTITVDDHALHNAGCEATDADNQPQDWTVGGTGDMTCLDLASDTDTDHTSRGDSSFTANFGGSVTAEQTVFVVPGDSYAFEGFYGTDAGTDYGTVELEYLDANGDPIAGEGVTLSTLESASTTEFDQFDTTTVAPAGAERATVRLSMTHDDDGTYAGVYYDDLTLEPLDLTPDAKDATLPSVAIDDALTESVLDDYGNGADHLGQPAADVVSFGGGDLGGSVSEHAAGETVSLAGGDLTLDADGSLELAGQTEAGTYAFDYRLRNAEGSDVATVTVTVTDDAQVDVSFADATDSVREGKTLALDVTADNVGTNTGYRNVSFAVEDATDAVVFEDERELALAAGADRTLDFEWATGTGDAGTYDVRVSSGDDAVTRQVSAYELATVEGRVADPNPVSGAMPVEDAVVTLRYPDGTEVETTTDASGDFSVADVPATGETYDVAVAADGYDADETTVTVNSGGVTDAGTVRLDGNATVSGTVADAATGQHLDGATVTVTNGPASYEAVTDASGSYAVEDVPGDRTYDVTVTAAGYAPEASASERVGDAATHDFDATLAGNATVEGAVTDDASGVPVENATVTVTYPNDDAFTVENATDEAGEFSVDSVPGTGNTYDLTVGRAGFEDASASLAVGDATVADAGTVALVGNAEIRGTVSDATFDAGLAGVEVTVSNGSVEVETTTDAVGEYAVSELPGERAYDVSVAPADWHANSTTVGVGDAETATDANVALAGTGNLSATVADALLASHSTDDDAVDGATVTVSDPSLGTVDLAADGTVGPVAVPGDDQYSVTASATGYHSETNASVPANSTAEFGLSGNATLTGNVTSGASGSGVENATLAVAYPDGEQVTVENATAADGSYAVAGVPGTGANYEVTATVRAYRDANASVAVPRRGGTADLTLVKRDRFLDVDGVTVPTRVEADSGFDIAANVTNIGATSWNASVAFEVDGSVVATESVTVAPGNRTVVRADHATDAVGDHDVTVRTANASATDSFEVVSRPSPPPSSSPASSSASSSDASEAEAITVPTDVTVRHEAVREIERDGETGRPTVAFGAKAGIERITFEESDVNGSVGVATLADESEATGSPPGVGVASYRVTGSADTRNGSARMRIRVSEARTAQLDVEPTDLSVYRYDGGEWHRLETTVADRDDDGVVVEARTQGFGNVSVSALRPPEAALTLESSEVNAGERVELSAVNSTDGDGEIVAYEWTVGERTYEGETVTVSRSEPGSYPVELNVTDADGERDTASATLVVRGQTTEIETETTATEVSTTATTGTTVDDSSTGFDSRALVVVVVVALAVGGATFRYQQS